jgi:septum formation protein
MLQGAGLAFTVVPADIDEETLRVTLTCGSGPADPGRVARELARAKAESVSRDHPNALVIGADQVLALGDRIFDKAKTVEDTRAALEALRGLTHDLFSAVVLAEGGNVTWSYLGRARMTMRDYSPDSLEDYLARAGTAICDSVGAYQIEGLGIQLFERVDGDFFTILGLPLLPLLAELRARKVVAS